MRSSYKRLDTIYYRKRFNEIFDKLFDIPENTFDINSSAKGAKSKVEIFHIGATFMSNMIGNPTLDILVVCDEFPFDKIVEKKQDVCDQMQCYFDSKLQVVRIEDVYYYWCKRKYRENALKYKILTDYINIHVNLKEELKQIKVDNDEVAKRSFFKRISHEALAWYEARKKNGPNPNDTYALPIVGQETCFIKNIITKPNIIVGEYTYYHSHDGVFDFENTNVLYHFNPQNYLKIGKFCSFASKILFIMGSANHQMDGSTYPFAVFSPECWAKKYTPHFPKCKDTVLGNDIWVGYDVTIMPGVTIGDGAIIAAKSVVVKDVPPYTIAGGNPCKVIKKRFDDETIEFYLKLKWWDWPIEQINENICAIVENDVEALKKFL